MILMKILLIHLIHSYWPIDLLKFAIHVFKFMERQSCFKRYSVILT